VASSQLDGWLKEPMFLVEATPVRPTALGVVGSDKEKAGVTGDANMHVGCGRDGRGQCEREEMVGSVWPVVVSAIFVFPSHKNNAYMLSKAYCYLCGKENC
jgi:hypothetical protein